MNTTEVLNHIYSHRPRNEKAMGRQTDMNVAMLKAAVNRIQDESRPIIKA